MPLTEDKDPNQMGTLAPIQMMIYAILVEHSSLKEHLFDFKHFFNYSKFYK